VNDFITYIANNIHFLKQPYLRNRATFQSHNCFNSQGAKVLGFINFMHFNFEMYKNPKLCCFSFSFFFISNKYFAQKADTSTNVISLFI